MSYSRTPRLGRSVAGRLGFPVLLVLLGAAPPARSAEPAQRGVVADQGGKPIARARVRIIDAGGREAGSTLTDATGRFELPASAPCRVEAGLAGFEPAIAACSSSELRLTLSVAPVEETVVVTATNTDVPTSQAGPSVSTFTADDLASRREPFVADLLRTTPGAMVVRTGAPGGVTSLFVRGGESDYNKVLIDGIPVNEPGGTFDFGNLTTDNLDRIEIVRGAHSALFGSDAMASVVQLFTKRADRSGPAARVSATIEGGSFDTLNATAAVSGASGRVDYMVGATRFTTDNEAPNDAFDNTSLTANAGVDIGHRAMLRGLWRAELGRAGTPGQTAFGRPDLDAFFENHTGVGGVTFDQNVTPSFHQHALYSLAASNQTSTDLVEDPPYTAQYQGHVAPYESTDFLYDSTTSLHRHYASYQADWRLPSALNAEHLLTALVDWNGERIHLVDRMAATDSRESRNNFGAAVQEQALWGRVFATLGGRIEHNDSFGTAAVPRGSIVVVAHEAGAALGETTLRVSGGLGIKEPTALQSFSTSPYFLGNPDLQPERSRSVEVGVGQRFGHDRAKLDFVWFDNHFHDLISLSPPDANFFAEYINVGETRARGAEAGVELAPAAFLRVRGGYTFLDSSVVTSTAPDNPLFVTGAELFRRPRHSGYAGATFTRDRLSIDLNGVFVHGYPDGDFASLVPPLTENPGYSLWNARLSITLTRQASLIGSIDNISDVSYMEPLGYPGLGRAGRLGVKLGF